MSQHVVTARDVAEAAGVSARLPDAWLICDTLDDALTKEGTPPIEYSNAARSLFQHAWAVASHKRSVQVTIFHLAYALVFHHPEAGKEMAEYLGTDIDSLAVGCILQILPRGVEMRDLAVVPPAVGAVRWLGTATALARRRDTCRELLPEDLIRTVLDGTLPTAIRGDLKRAAKVGEERGPAVIGPRRVPLIETAPSSPRDIIKHLEEVERGHPPTQSAAESGLEITRLTKLFEEFEQRYGSDIDEQKLALTRVETLIKGRLATVETRSLPIDTFMSKLELIDRRVSTLGEALPVSPSNGKLAAAIFTVLVLGVAVGLALSLWQSSALVSQVFSVSAK